MTLLAAASACGDDSSSTGPDACAGHLQCGDGPKITDPEGGNILFEYIWFDTELQAAFQLPAGVTSVNRVIGYFMNSHTPNANPLPTAGACNNLETTRGWPLYVGNPHEDLDVGTFTITGKNMAGTDVSIDVPKKPMGLDNIGRPHNTFYEIIQPDASKFIKPDSAYTVKFGGNGSIPATTFDNNIFLAQDFAVNMPMIEGNGPLVAGTDFNVKWTPATSANLPAGDEVLGVTWLVDTNGKPTHICPAAHTAGQFTIPGAAITEYKAVATARGTNPNKVILLRNAIVHKLARLPNGDKANARRIDMLSVMCYAQLMNVN
ncbi:MAG TPA: hypothetical protein VN253_06175 [Kofleriaceae bacterium]|nr:hypothetical protein [Kofleriaceae bacterium]